MTISISSATFLQSSQYIDQCPAADRPEYAFIGRSNVGKSSLINTLCGVNKLARTSSTPGRTQLMNYFTVQSVDNGVSTETDGEVSSAVVHPTNHSWYLVDLPGYGYAKVSKSIRADLQGMIEDYFDQRSTIAHVFVLIDGRHTPQAIDIEFLAWLHTTGKTYSLVFTKSDKVSQKDLSNHVKLFLSELGKKVPETLEGESMPQCFMTSAEKRQSTYGIAEKIHHLHTT
jgi:GTP-binding protein